jgi:hypothetical protein
MLKRCDADGFELCADIAGDGGEKDDWGFVREDDEDSEGADGFVFSASIVDDMFKCSIKTRSQQSAADHM